MKSKTVENTILRISALLISNDNVIEMGDELLNAGADKLEDGGFYIWDIQNIDIEYYSPLFRKILGYNDENDFPNLSSSWQNAINKDDLKLALLNFEKSKEDPDNYPYYQNVTYTKKKGGIIRVLCSALILKKNGKPRFLIGTHKILDNA